MCSVSRLFLSFLRFLMGAPKQKWTSEEEAALKAGILKHGPGKWRTILKDPEFSGVLCLRSNVDLKVEVTTIVFSLDNYVLCRGSLDVI